SRRSTVDGRKSCLADLSAVAPRGAQAEAHSAKAGRESACGKVRSFEGGKYAIYFCVRTVPARQSGSGFRSVADPEHSIAPEPEQRVPGRSDVGRSTRRDCRGQDDGDYSDGRDRAKRSAYGDRQTQLSGEVQSRRNREA